MSVIARIEPRVIPTYPVGAPEKNPLFFEKRVYQGSSGKVYPVPFIDKVFDQAEPVTYQSALLENEFVRLVMLPEIGGRIFLGQDKTNHDYDFFYRQDVIKPALVGLAGPWISGGVEFNWPQHHRPGTFMPADVFIEEEPDGARTVWMSEHDPLNRMKGMHGIRLRPGSSLIELRGRLYNRTPLTQTFLWWANVAAMVHDQYQSFFPPDVRYVADHAVRAMSSFPMATNPYYGVDYQNRPDANDLSWYRNIPVPTSYMVCQTQSDFFGGYDFAAGGGFLHVANRHIAPGKKQWTWGNHEFGWAWDRELTDTNGPYIELMAGVYTDNQPDFTYLTPYETKTFSQFWWPIQGIGPVQQANGQVALRMVVRDDRMIDLGVCVSESLQNARLVVTHRGDVILEESLSLAPGEHWKHHGMKFIGENPAELKAMIFEQTGNCLLEYRPVDEQSFVRNRELATEPPAPEEMASSDELYFTGEHLELYRHPTRSPELYWNEALRRDSGDARCNIAMGRRALRQGRLKDAERYFRTAINRLTRRHPNPETGEAHYFLGLSLAFKGERENAYAALYKATWNQAWRAPAYYQIACLDCRNHHYDQALIHLKDALVTNADHTKASVLQAVIARHHGDLETARGLLENVLKIDPLDHWARHEGTFCGLVSNDDFLTACRNDAQTILDLAFDYSDAGFAGDAAALIKWHLDQPVTPTAVPNPSSRSPMCLYALAWMENDLTLLAEAGKQSADYFFPSRIHEQLILEWALAQKRSDPVAAYALGNYYYDLKRHEDAIAAWKQAADHSTGIATAYRNLGIAIWNARRDGNSARAHYLQALNLDPRDPRLVSEYDQLRSKLNDPVAERLRFLEDKADLVLQRDDCTVALATLYNLTGSPEKALEILTSRRFHPWEGGEGTVLRQFTNAHLLLGRRALAAGDPTKALAHFSGAMETPDSLGEAYHLLQAKADVNYWIGKALKALGRTDEAEQWFSACANEVGDFSNMAVIAHSPLSYDRGMALREMGRHKEADSFFHSLKSYAENGIGEAAKIDYFATSLPNLLVFDEDLQAQRDSEFHLLIALACHGLGDAEGARTSVSKMMEFTNANQRAADLASEMANHIEPANPLMKAVLCIFAATALSCFAWAETPQTLDLAGEWRLALDAGDLGLSAGPSTWTFNDTIVLPNTLTLAKKGEPLAKEARLDKSTLANLHQRFSHLGPAWFQRDFIVPPDWSGMDVQFEIERVLWESRLWINGKEAGMRDSLCVPHRYEVESLIQPGRNTLTLRIDNREKFPIGIGHAYTNATQTIWNGAIGRIQLTAMPKVRLEAMQLRPAPGGKLIVTLETSNHTGAAASGDCEIVVTHPDGRELKPVKITINLPSGTEKHPLPILLGPEPTEWSEFEPMKYKVRVSMKSPGGVSEITDDFGYRIFRAEGRRFLINGRPVFLRGTLECCIFPKTGHPDMTGKEWEKIFTTVKAYGLNHVRFHSWCPPKIAFELADRHGVYLQVELPNWSFEMGRRPAVDEFFKLEGERILKEYGNHPSFVMFSLGNELDGDLGAMDRLLEHFRKTDPDKVFTSTSFAFSSRGKKPGPQDDYFISQETASGWVRGQGFLNQTPPNTESDYAAGLSSIKVPLVTHEVGQYNNYPNLAELPKYEEGALRQLGYEAIRDDLKSKGRLNDAPRLTRDSGKLAVLLYKEDMERALRTKDLAGIQLLDLHDFPGQSTATVGVLDAFWDSKGLVTAEEFSEFTAPSVPLVRLKKMTWENTETFVATVEIAHFGKLPIKDASIDWELKKDDGSAVDSGTFQIDELPLGNGIRIGTIESSLSKILTASRLNLVVSVRGTKIRNRWPVWVYPSPTPALGENVLVLNSPGRELSNALAAGKKVLLLPPRAALQAPIDARFIPVFWSPLHFPNQPGTLGSSIDSHHPVFRDFPTDTFTNWQWWELFATSHAMDLNDLNPKPAMPLTFVDKFDRNALPAAIWETKCGPGKLLVCTLDISSDLPNRIVARQLRQSILHYMVSGDFNPAVQLSSERLNSLFRTVRFVVGAVDRNPSHPPELAVDGDENSFWHTDWSSGGNHLPAKFTMDLGKEMVLRGIRYTPRQDMNRGRIERFLIEVGNDGKTWHAIGGERKFEDTTTPQVIEFEKPIKARYLALTTRSDHGRANHAAIAEIEPLTVESPDVRELGIIPGFND